MSITSRPMAGSPPLRPTAGPPARSPRTPCCGSWASRATPTVRGQLTDTYLLALAVHRGGRLVSFDRRLSCDAVVGGRETLWLLDG
jgi:hypothetical protein